MRNLYFGLRAVLLIVISASCSQNGSTAETQSTIANPLAPSPIGADSAHVAMHGPNSSVEQAIAWARGQLGVSWKPYTCLTFVRTAYGFSSSFANAEVAIGVAMQKGLLRSGNILDAPRGSWLLWYWNALGHVAIKTEPNRMIHAITRKASDGAVVEEVSTSTTIGTFAGWVNPEDLFALLHASSGNAGVEPFTVSAAGLPEAIPNPGSITRRMRITRKGTIDSITLFFEFPTQCERNHFATLTNPEGMTVNVMNRGLERCSGVRELYSSRNVGIGGFFDGRRADGEWVFTMQDLDADAYNGTLNEVTLTGNMRVP